MIAPLSFVLRGIQPTPNTVVLPGTCSGAASSLRATTATSPGRLSGKLL